MRPNQEESSWNSVYQWCPSRGIKCFSKYQITVQTSVVNVDWPQLQWWSERALWGSHMTWLSWSCRPGKSGRTNVCGRTAVHQRHICWRGPPKHISVTASSPRSRVRICLFWSASESIIIWIILDSNSLRFIQSIRFRSSLYRCCRCRRRHSYRWHH